jgi:hypothetical protein
MWNCCRGVESAWPDFRLDLRRKLNRTAPARRTARLAGSGDRHFILDQWHEFRRQVLQNLHGQLAICIFLFSGLPAVKNASAGSPEYVRSSAEPSMVSRRWSCAVCRYWTAQDVSRSLGSTVTRASCSAVIPANYPCNCWMISR